MDITIGIATKNRHRFLSIVLEYYSKQIFKGKLLIIDGSNNEIYKKNLDLVNSYSNIQINHFYSPLIPNFAYKEHASKIDTKYFTISGDDDFHLIQGLEKGIDYLEKNNLSGVRGKAYLFYLNKTMNKIEEIRDYSGYDYKSSIILENIEKYFNHPRSVSSCIFKTSSFKEALKLHLSSNQINLCPSRYFYDELLLGSIVVSTIKIGKINECQFIQTYNEVSHKTRSDWEIFDEKEINISVSYTANKLFNIIKSQNQKGDLKRINEIINNFILNKYVPALKNKLKKNYLSLYTRFLFRLLPLKFQILIKYFFQKEKKILRILKGKDLQLIKSKTSLIEKLFIDK